MSIIEQFWTIAPFTNGDLNSEFPLGNTPLPAWQTIPSFTKSAAFSINIQTAFLTPPTGATVVVSGSLPTGWTFVDPTLSYSGTNPGAAATIHFTATFDSVPADSNSFTVQGVASVAQTAPRFGFVDNSPGGTSPQYPQSRAQRVARGDAVVMGFYAGIGSECYGPSGNSYKNYTDYIHSLNPNCMLFPYQLPDSQGTSNQSNGEPWPDLTAAVNRNAWVVYNNWPSRSGPVTSYFNTNPVSYVANSTSFAQTDTNGFKLEEYAADLGCKLFFQGIGSSASTDFNPGADGGWRDNVFTDLTVPGDWQQNGTSFGPIGVPNEGNSSIALNYRTGLGSWATRWRTSSGGKLALGNIGRWGNNTPQGGNLLTGLTGCYNGGLIEECQGVSFSTGTFGGATLVKFQVQTCLANTLAPKKIGIGCAWDTNGRGFLGNSKGLPPFQDARAQFTLCLQDDAECWLAVPQTNYTDVSNYAPGCTWLDEFCVVGHTCQPEATPQLGKRYLGTRTNGPWALLSASSGAGNGVYATQYSDGTNTWVVLHNPLGNGPQTLSISALFPGFTHLQKLSGTQAPSINNGASVTSVPLADYDGLIGILVP